VKSPGSSRGFRFSVHQYTIIFMSKFFQFVVLTCGGGCLIGTYYIVNLLDRIHELLKQVREELARIRANQT
jgi:hypothetical protein